MKGSDKDYIDKACADIIEALIKAGEVGYTCHTSMDTTAKVYGIEWVRDLVLEMTADE